MATNENMTVHLKVKDYAIWRTGYDAREKNRNSAALQMEECSAEPKIRTMW